MAVAPRPARGARAAGDDVFFVISSGKYFSAWRELRWPCFARAALRYSRVTTRRVQSWRQRKWSALPNALRYYRGNVNFAGTARRFGASEKQQFWLVQNGIHL